MLSKIDLTDELRRRGVWPDASVFRDGQRQALRNAGMPKRLAAEESWSRVADIFENYLVGTHPFRNDVELPLVDLFPELKRPGIEADFAWIFRNLRALGGSDVTSSTARLSSAAMTSATTEGSNITKVSDVGPFGLDESKQRSGTDLLNAATDDGLTIPNWDDEAWMVP